VCILCMCGVLMIVLRRRCMLPTKHQTLLMIRTLRCPLSLSLSHPHAPPHPVVQHCGTVTCVRLICGVCARRATTAGRRGDARETRRVDTCRVEGYKGYAVDLCARRHRTRLIGVRFGACCDVGHHSAQCCREDGG
jgi:hypothetical protein